MECVRDVPRELGGGERRNGVEDGVHQFEGVREGMWRDGREVRDGGCEGCVANLWQEMIVRTNGARW